MRSSNSIGVVSLIGLSIAVVLYIVINTLFNAAAPGMRLDLTEDGLYTLSQGTKTTLARIDEPLKLQFFFSERLAREVPFYAAYARRVRELLLEIVAVSRNKVVLHEHNPEPFSAEEDLAVSLGVQGIPVDQGGELAYFGLAASNSADDTKLIPFFQPEHEKLLEYDLVKMIHALSNTEPTTVGVMSSLPIMGDMPSQSGVMIPWAMGKRLKRDFNVLNLPQTLDDLPNDISVMMVVNANSMSERALYSLEQFLFRGGRAIFFIDPKTEANTSPGAQNQPLSANGILKLLAKWNVQIPQDQLIGDKSMALRINAGSAARPVPADYLLWLGVTADNMSQDDPVTGQLATLNLASSGHIMRENDSPLAMEPLLSSTQNSSLIAIEDASGLNPDVLGLLERFKPDDYEYVLAARLTGTVNTTFANGPPPRVIEKANPDAPQLMQSSGPINVILVADSDLLEDRFWLQKQQFFGREVEQAIAGNADFVVNALGNLAGSDELLKLRSRGSSQRPFDKVKKLQQTAERRLQDKERELQDKLKQTQSRVAALEGVQTVQDAITGKTKVQISLTDEQRAEVETRRNEMLSIRKQLRDVQRGLREDVEKLETMLQFVNIGLVPIVVSVIAIVLSALRVARRRRSYVSSEERGIYAQR